MDKPKTKLPYKTCADCARRKSCSVRRDDDYCQTVQCTNFKEAK